MDHSKRKKYVLILMKHKLSIVVWLILFYELRTDNKKLYNYKLNFFKFDMATSVFDVCV